MPDRNLAAAPEPAGVDIGALAGWFKISAADLVAGAVVHAFEAMVVLADLEAELGCLETTAFVSRVLQDFDGFELRAVRELKEELELQGVPTWGLTDEHTELLGG